MGRRRLIIASAVALSAIGLAARLASPALAIEHHPKTLADLRGEAVLAATTTPERRKIRVLIVPGHEPNDGGTRYGNIKERDLAVALGKDLQRSLDADGRYETILSRDGGGWNPDIADYFSKHWDEIDDWRKQARAEMSALIASGSVTAPVVRVGHNLAAHDAAVRLYGITKWANEHDIDLMVHVHFDDDRPSTRVAGHDAGFAVFVPPPQYLNAAPTRAAAEKVMARLAAFDPIGGLPGEADGVVEDPGLIAVGEQNTSDPASMLIEYGFIYERRLRTPAVRTMAIDDMAYQTSLGLDDFFFGGPPAPVGKFPTTVLPHAWLKPIRDASADPADVYALQTALILDGDAPPPGKTLADCPRSAVFDACTRAAVKRFQQKYGITGEIGVAGKKTLARLSAL